MWSAFPLIVTNSPPIATRRPFQTPRMSAGDPLSTIGRLLWGRSLPPQPLISAVRSTWSATWHLMMRQLAPSDPTTHSYSRPPSSFPTVPPSYSSQNPNPNLVLFVGLPCPWAHRTLIVRALKDLESELPVTIAAASADRSWEIDGGRRALREVYATREGGYDGRSTVPMLWDAERREVVCNESYGIIQFLNSGFGGGNGVDLAPDALRGEIERWNRIVYPNLNNGVYRCGFAQSQEAYDAAVSDLFGTLDVLDSHLATSRYLCGSTLTLADVCLFTTLIRFDPVYNVLFKCTKKKLLEYPNLHGYMREIYQIPKVAETCDFEAIMDGYYRILFPLNPGGIRPVMPSVCEHEQLLQPHNRHTLSLEEKQTSSSAQLTNSTSS